MKDFRDPLKTVSCRATSPSIGLGIVSFLFRLYLWWWVPENSCSEVFIAVGSLVAGRQLWDYTNGLSHRLDSRAIGLICEDQLTSDNPVTFIW